ncbi:hypothetical protein [Marinobacter alexandrii]|jgi:hypothetical protein|uniref:hypothetical protein n=1 Tax=Marinobacter alexandrii TaxID=2570351 RepID=UPI002ABDB0D1|nr:hypothetical protein [Marinobacter alexandrii]
MKRLCLMLVASVTSGCASYYSHYAMFPAQNSAGEPRQIRLSWQSADYPDWWFASDKATAIRVETQCSERIWRLRDIADPQAGECGAGIRACGQAGQDLHAPSGELATAGVRCMIAEPDDPKASVAAVSGSLDLLVSCVPATTTVRAGDEERNVDYLRASPVPYTVFVRKAPRGSLRAKMPEFDESACDAQ